MIAIIHVWTGLTNTISPALLLFQANIVYHRVKFPMNAMKESSGSIPLKNMNLIHVTATHMALGQTFTARTLTQLPELHGNLNIQNAGLLMIHVRQTQIVIRKMMINSVSSR